MADSNTTGSIIFLEASSSAQAFQLPESSTASAAVPTPPCDDTDKSDEFAEPEFKKRKTTGDQGDKGDGPVAGPVEKLEQKLESRLGSILGCVVCFDLPNAAVYQVFISWLLSLSHYCLFLNFKINISIIFMITHVWGCKILTSKFNDW